MGLIVRLSARGSHAWTVSLVESDPIPTNVLLLKQGAGDFHRRAVYAHALKSLDRTPHCPRLVVLEADVHRTQALVHRALGGDEDANIQAGNLGKVVVCFMDVEKFQPGLLRDLIYLLFVLRSARHGRPGVVSDVGNVDCQGLVLCTYGTQDVLFERLGTRESTMVDVQAHHLPHTSTCINRIIAEVRTVEPMDQSLASAKYAKFLCLTSTPFGSRIIVTVSMTRLSFQGELVLNSRLESTSSSWMTWTHETPAWGDLSVDCAWRSFHTIPTTFKTSSNFFRNCRSRKPRFNSGRINY
mmetsp:Transcript_16092/g.66298  ORF Transcript_16092/g.66298 Transcript_16092/m.66298 type:complete len:298 (-) Transcript_16092:1622-2515(-)